MLGCHVKQSFIHSFPNKRGNFKDGLELRQPSWQIGLLPVFREFWLKVLFIGNSTLNKYRYSLRNSQILRKYVLRMGNRFPLTLSKWSFTIRLMR